MERFGFDIQPDDLNELADNIRAGNVECVGIQSQDVSAYSIWFDRFEGVALYSKSQHRILTILTRPMWGRNKYKMVEFVPITSRGRRVQCMR
jgi:hypothetical protein